MPRLDVSQVWRANHPWAPFYAAVAEHRVIGPVLWRLALGTDLGRLHRAAARELEALPGGAAVLDVPCGSGIALRGARPAQRLRYVAADIAPAMLDRARDEAGRLGLEEIELLEADAQALPFGDGEFDLAIAFTSLHCFPQPQRAVAELGRCVRPGGRVTGSAFLTDGGLRFEPWLRGGRLAGLMGPSGSTADVRRWLGDAGFEGIELERSGALTYFSADRG